MDRNITLTVNGKKNTITTDPQRPLLDVLREDLHVTGPKYGCGEGRCGACAVIMDGKRTLACITPVVRADNKSITTIEGLSSDNKLHPVQEAFLAEEAMQCGYCTNGMIMTAAALLEKNPNPTDAEIVSAMNGNICRCNGYTKILAAIKRAAKQR
jgi:aerobic-type carbon monoxide dehydrogenase small subunit (CoxS/CutS family)